MTTEAGLSENEPLAEAAVGAAPALGQKVGRGATWMVLSNVCTKGLSFLAFWIMLKVVSPADVGVWTMAFSFAAFTQAFRDGGVAMLLIKRGEKDYQSLVGPVFWMAMAFNLACAVVLSALAPLQAHVQHEPRLMLLLWLIAAAMPLSTPASILGARVQMQLRFGAYAGVATVSAIIRSGGTMALVLAGMGPVSFVLPLPVIALFESTAFFLLTRDQPWRRGPAFARWGELFREGKWFIFIALSMAFLNQGTLFALQMVIPANPDLLGIISTAYLLVYQVDQLLTATVVSVLFPAMSLLNNEPERQAAATGRAARMMCVVACAATLGLVVCMGPVERLLWGGKWEAAVWPAQVLSLCYVWRMLFFVPLLPMQARGLFKLLACLTLLAGLGQMIAAAVGALVWGNTRSIAAVLAVYTGVGFMAFVVYGMKRVGVRGRVFLTETLPTWLVACAAGAVGVAAQQWLHPRIVAWNGGRLGALVEFTAAGLVFSGAYLVLMRVLLAKRLREVALLAPGRLHKFLRWV